VHPSSRAHTQAAGHPSGPQTADNPSASPAASSASDVSGIKGTFSRTPTGETRWNRSATSGNATSQTTNETASPFTNPTQPRRNPFFQRRPSRRSSLVSGSGPGKTQPATGPTPQANAPTARNES